MNRREFFTALGVVGAARQLAAQGPPGLLGGTVVRADWLSRHTEPIIEPDLPIIDPHHQIVPRKVVLGKVDPAEVRDTIGDEQFLVIA